MKMPPMFSLYPVILTDSMVILEKQLKLIKDNPALSVVQIDIIDGLFADNYTINLFDLLTTDFAHLQLDFHLMTEEPLDFVLELEAVIDQLPVRSVIAQIERMSFPEDYLLEVKRLGCRAGLSLDLHTPLSAIEEEVWPELDIIQLMGVEVGYQGQKFQPSVLSKITELKQILAELEQQKDLAPAEPKTDQSQIEIMVDGGVKLINAKKILAAGATGLVVGSELWQAKDFDLAVNKFQKIFKSAAR